MASEDISAVASLFILLIGGVCGCVLAIWRSERRRQQRHRRHHHQRGGSGWRHEAAERRERLRSKVRQLISAFRQRGRAGTSRGGGGRQKRGGGSRSVKSVDESAPQLAWPGGELDSVDEIDGLTALEEDLRLGYDSPQEYGGSDAGSCFSWHGSTSSFSAISLGSEIRSEIDSCVGESDFLPPTEISHARPLSRRPLDVHDDDDDDDT